MPLTSAILPEATMRVVEYEVVIESVGGQELRRVTLMATTSHPVKGDEIKIEGRTFVVSRVTHLAEGRERKTTREYSFVRLHARPRIVPGGGRRATA
jgi:hypothetical protein